MVGVSSALDQFPVLEHVTTTPHGEDDGGNLSADKASLTSQGKPTESISEPNPPQNVCKTQFIRKKAYAISSKTMLRGRKINSPSPLENTTLQLLWLGQSYTDLHR